jgi:hypothetical protein
MSRRKLGWRDRIQIANTAAFFLLGVVLAVRGFQVPSVPIFLLAAALTAYAIYRFAWIRRFYLGEKPPGGKA